MTTSTHHLLLHYLHIYTRLSSSTSDVFYVFKRKSANGSDTRFSAALRPLFRDRLELFQRRCDCSAGPSEPCKMLLHSSKEAIKAFSQNGLTQLPLSFNKSAMFANTAVRRKAECREGRFRRDWSGSSVQEQGKFGLFVGTKKLSPLNRRSSTACGDAYSSF